MIVDDELLVIQTQTLITGNSDIDEAFTFMYQSIMRKIKNMLVKIRFS